MYTTGNKENEEQFKRAAETKAAAIRNDGRFDSKKDTVLVVGVSTKKEVQTAFDSAKQLESQFGKVAQVQMFSHAGPVNGPVLPGEPKDRNQFTAAEMSNLRINWEKGGQAWFYGCNTAKFAQDFANAQGVTAWGYDKFAYFSNSETSMIPDADSSKPVYLIAADYGEANGTGAAIRYVTGFGRVYDLKVKNPRVRKY